MVKHSRVLGTPKNENGGHSGFLEILQHRVVFLFYRQSTIQQENIDIVPSMCATLSFLKF